MLVPLPGRPRVAVASRLCVNDHLGFGLHAATTAGALDTRARQALAKYVLRPPLAIPKPAAPPAEKDSATAAHSPLPPESERPSTHRCRYRPYLELVARTFGDDLAACERCGGRMRLVALVRDQESIARFLRAIGEPVETPPLAPAHGPPFFTPPGSPGATTADTVFAPEPPDESS
jgi:hypothetical protein